MPGERLLQTNSLCLFFLVMSIYIQKSQITIFSIDVEDQRMCGYDWFEVLPGAVLLQLNRLYCKVHQCLSI